MSRYPTRTQGLILSLLLGGGCPALAGTDEMASIATGGYAIGARTREMMLKVDTNGDGMVSRAEWSAFHEKVFSLLDRHQKGSVADDEFIYARNDELETFATGGFARGLRTEEMMKLIDTNHDGHVSRAEYMADQMKIFDLMDTSSTHKGSLDASQVIASGGPDRR